MNFSTTFLINFVKLCKLNIEYLFVYIQFTNKPINQSKHFQAILVKGVVTNDIVGRPTEIRFFYKQAENENYVVYFPNFNLTMRDPGNYGELAMITLPKYVQARFVILGKAAVYIDNYLLTIEYGYLTILCKSCGIRSKAVTINALSKSQNFSLF